MKTSLAVKITQTPVNLHKKQLPDTLWKHKISYSISKCRRRGRGGWMPPYPPPASVDCDLRSVCWSEAQLGVIESGWGSEPAGPRPWLSAGGRDLSPVGGGSSICSEWRSSGYSGPDSSRGADSLWLRSVRMTKNSFTPIKGLEFFRNSFTFFGKPLTCFLVEC